MAISKADFNNINITPTASKAIKWNSAADGFEAGALGGSMVLLATQTASGSANLSFTSGIDDTYDSYVFKFINMHPSTNAYTLFQGTTDGTNYNTTITSTAFSSYHDEGDAFALLQYRPAADLAQGTGFQHLNEADSVGTDNDMSMSGYLKIFNPSSTVFVKHFIATCNSKTVQPMPNNTFVAGYFNTTSAITGIRFQQNNGNIDSGVIKMYGIT